MKLLQINVTANWGSTGKIVESICNVTQLYGIENYVAYGRDITNSISNLIKVGGSLNPYFHYVENYFLDREGLSSRCATRTLVNHIKNIKPDIIHLHNIHDHWLNYPILFNYLNETDIPIVWTFHDCWAFTGHCYHFIDSGCYKWKTHCGNCPLRNRFRDNSYRNFELKKELFSRAKNLTIVAVSEWMASFVKDSFFKGRPIEVIHNGVDLSVFRRLDTKEQSSNGTYRILAVSSVWTKSKGLYDLYSLREILPDNFEITIVGLTKDQIKHLPKGIIGIERTKDINELVSLYNYADVLINPTYADTFPTVNLEALACGTPVITYMTGGSPEAIDEYSGVVIPQGDIVALADSILKIKEVPLASFKCRERAVKYFDKDNCFSRYIELYEKLLDSKN